VQPMSNSHASDMIARIAKALAILLMSMTILALIAMRVAYKVNPIEYAGLPRYRRANIQLSLVSSEHRVVFLGDSITDFWELKKFFPDQPYVNRGIAGQTTSQMLLRFHRDVIDLKPALVVIMAGINDIGAGIPAETTEDNYAAMREMASANHIAVYFGSVLPVSKSRRDLPSNKITGLNNWLRIYSKNSGARYVDYWSRMADSSGFLLPGLSVDGLHFNAAGYAVMQSELAAELSRADARP
jgi:lysophospholipase L1-like esterase